MCICVHEDEIGVLICQVVQCCDNFCVDCLSVYVCVFGRNVGVCYREVLLVCEMKSECLRFDVLSICRRWEWCEFDVGVDVCE